MEPAADLLSARLLPQRRLLVPAVLVETGDNHCVRIPAVRRHRAVLQLHGGMFCVFATVHCRSHHNTNLFRPIIGVIAVRPQFVGVCLTYRFRNQKDPRGHSGAFL